MDYAFPAVAPAGRRNLSCWRIGLTYWWRHDRLADLDAPRLFTELVQNRKLHDRDRRLPLYADKVRAKTIVADLLGKEWIIPTWWHGTALPETAPWPLPIVVKSRHGCNQNIFVREAGDWQAVRRRAARWMRGSYGTWLDEWLYTQIPRGLLVEPFLGTGAALPIDYKFYVFGGRVEYIQVHLGRGTGHHRWILFDRDWRRVSSPSSDADPAKPASIARMIEAAETLGGRMEFVRVDLYEIGGRPLFGEMTFYPGSGLDRFAPVTLDAVLGAHWLRARTRLVDASA